MYFNSTRISIVISVARELFMYCCCIWLRGVLCCILCFTVWSWSYYWLDVFCIHWTWASSGTKIPRIEDYSYTCLCLFLKKLSLLTVSYWVTVALFFFTPSSIYMWCFVISLNFPGILLDLAWRIKAHWIWNQLCDCCAPDSIKFTPSNEIIFFIILFNGNLH